MEEEEEAWEAQPGLIEILEFIWKLNKQGKHPY